MSTNFANSAIFSGATQGVTQGLKDNYTPEGQANKAAARVKKEQMDQQLDTLRATRPTDEDLTNQAAIQTQELQKLREQNNQLLGAQTKTRIFDSFDRYTGDNDTRHLNTMLQDMRQNPYGQKIFGNITRVDKLTEQDTDLVKRAGVDPELIFQNPAILNRLVKVTNADGSQSAYDMQSLFKMTGYTAYAQDKELKVMKERADIYTAYKDTGAKSPKERLAYDETVNSGLKPGTPEFDARYLAMRIKYGVGKEAGEGGDPSQDYKAEAEREAYRLTKADGLEPNSAQGQDRFMQHYTEIQKRNRTPSAVKQANEVDDTTARVDEKAAALGKDFFDIDFSNPRNRRKFEPEIQRIEKLGGFELSSDQRKDLGYIKSLVKLGPPTQKLNDQETGLVDNLLFNAKKYMSDNVKGVDATSAYATFRNTIRHALYGSALTDSEIASFEEQFGNLKQQRGPVLAQLKTAVEQVQGKLESIESLGNSYVTHFRLGADDKAISTMIDNLDKLTNHLDALKTKTSDDTTVGGTTQPTKLAPKDIEGLDAIFKKGSK